MDLQPCAERPASAEGNSTRPNPFDDADASSRKRRRTGSPVDETASPTPVFDGSADQTTNFDIDASAESAVQPNRDREPRRQPSSSKVTLNLRQSLTATGSSQATPPKGGSPQTNSSPTEQVTGAIHQSVETAFEDPSVLMTDQLKPVTPDQGRSPSAGAISTEGDDTQGDDEKAPTDTASFGPSGRFELDSEAIIPPFPFNNGADELTDTLRLVVQHVDSQSSFPNDVLASVNAWLSTFAQLFQNMDDRAILHVWENGRFWHTLPELLHEIVKQTVSTPVLLSTESRVVILDFYKNFTKLTASFMIFDYGNLSEFASYTDSSSNQVPDLFSMEYLCHLVGPLGLALPTPRSRETSLLADILLTRHDIAHYLRNVFCETTDDLWGNLHRLSQIMADLIPIVPKFASLIGPLCQVLEVLALHASRLEHEEGAVENPKRPLDRVQDIWKVLDSSVGSTIEKRISSLTKGAATIQLESLREALKIYLLGRPQLVLELYQAGKEDEESLSSGLEADIISWEWYFDRMIQLIRSSQMQLRVFAAASMCSNLVTIWQRFSESSEDDERDRLLNRVGSYLLRTNLVAYLFGPNCHPEIILESANIVGFLVINKQYRAEHTEQLWQTITTAQDPRIADALSRMVSTIANLFDYEGLLGLCAKLQTLPINSFTPAIRQLWTSILKSMTEKVQGDNSLMTFHPYQMCLQLLRESSVCTSSGSILCPELQSTALQGLRDVLGVGEEDLRRQYRQQLFLSCLQDLDAKSRTTLGSLWALSLAIRPAIASGLSLLTEQHDLSRLVVEELHHAVHLSQDESAATVSVLCGPPNQPRREFVAQIIQYEPLTLEGKLGTRLWDVLVGHQAASQSDRNAGWDILNSSVRKLSFQNHYLSTCFTDRLPALPSSCFCQGLLEFVRAQVLPLACDLNSPFFEDDSGPSHVGLEQLWRLITNAEDDKLAELAIQTLSAEVYLDSPLIQTFPVSRTRQIHSGVVARCLQLLRSSAQGLRGTFLTAEVPTSMRPANEPTEPGVGKFERVFDRTIQLLASFLGRYRSKPGFAIPDLRSFMPEAPSQVEGDLTQLKYQSFDGNSQTDVKPLNIGNLNTAASLLASLRQETGFQNYRAFYRGRPFVPTEDDICKSLEDLEVREGLILVKKEEDERKIPSRIKPGSSPLEVEISGHFDELQSYLDLPEPLAREVLNLLTMLPADQHFMRAFEDSTRSHREIFPPNHPFRTLYAIYTMMPYLEAVKKVALRREEGGNVDQLFVSSYTEATLRCISWLSDALSDPNLTIFGNLELRFEVQTQLMSRFRHLLTVIQQSRTDQKIVHPTPEHFLDLLSTVLSHGNISLIQELVAQALAAIFRLGISNPTTWEKFKRTPGFSIFFQDLILRESRQEVRVLLARLVDDVIILEAQQGRDIEESSLTMFFWKIFSVLLEEAEEHATQSYEMFKTCTALLRHISASSAEEAHMAIGDTTKKLGQILLTHESIEEPGRPDAFDVFTHSVVAMLHFCLNAKNGPNAVDVLPSHFAANLIDRHLFPRYRESETEPVPRVMLHLETRKQTCEIIVQLIQGDRDSLKAVLPALHRLLPYYTDREEVYHYDLPYGNFDREKFIRASCGYTGLRNLSNTCYLNSLVNQLFMNPRFRHFLLNVRGDTSNTELRLLNSTKRLLSYLQESWNAWVDPEEFVSALKTFEETPIDIHSQMDVDEFYNLLFDQWEGEMGSLEEKRELRSFFGGQLVQQVKSKECDHISERLEPFSAIQCDIKGKTTLDASLQAYVDGEIMEGDNKYKCSTCDRHVDAVKRACLKDIPDNLIFHLKRFDFNLRTLQRSKINDYFSFPHEIDMAPYTIDHLSDPSKGEADNFQLVGVLVHSGTAESGHYYSYIKERPTSPGRANWFEFNDETVSQWDPSFLEPATFGGYDYRSTDESNCGKSYSAYMLFYQRSSTLRTEQQTMSSGSQVAPLRVDIDPKLKNHILDENTVLLRRYCLFDPSHPVLVSHCVQAARKADDDGSMGLVPVGRASSDADSECSDSPTGHELQTSGLWLALNHLDQVVSRSSGLHHFRLYQELLRNAVISCTDCALQVLEYFRQRAEAFRSLLQRNQDHLVRRFASELVLFALRKVAEERPWIYQPTAPLTPDGASTMAARVDDNPVSDHPVSLPESMRGVLRHVWKGFHASIRAWDEVFSFIHGFGGLGHHETAILLADDWLLKILRMVAADSAIEARANYQRMLQNLSRRSRPASFSAIISLIAFLLEALEPVMSAESIVEDAVERLAISEPPFPWTSLEVNLLLHHPRWRTSSLFVEKLVALEQSSLTTDQILCRLMDSGDAMNLAVFSTLKNNIPGEAAAPSMNPFLRAAACFVRNTEALDLARKLVFHVTGQAGKLQHGEGIAYVDFFKSIMAGGFVKSSFEKDIREKALENVPDWAPALLVSFEPLVRQATTTFLDRQLFEAHTELSQQELVDDDGSSQDDRALQGLIRNAVQTLGVNCLVYLRDSHVNPQSPITKDAAESILQVINACRTFCHEDGEDTDMQHAEAYRVLYAEILPALQPQIVEELDADVSEWDASPVSSEVGMGDPVET